MNILLTGASGLIGSFLAEYLFARGHSFFSLRRNKSAGGPFWNFDRLTETGSTPAFDAVVHLAGENIATGRWTREKKEKILTSRTTGTAELAAFCARLKYKPAHFISASAVGYYGNSGTTVVDESSPSGNNFVAQVCREWEEASAPAAQAGIRVVHGRIGMVLSGRGGTLSTMLPPFRLGLGGVVGKGTQYLSWVALSDLAAMFLFILETPDISGPVNLVAPSPVTNAEFAHTLGKVLRRPAFFRMPAFAARRLFGQMADELILSSTRVVPRLLLERGYSFRSADLETTLTNCLDEGSARPAPHPGAGIISG